jgi:hypothetical protein
MKINLNERSFSSGAFPKAALPNLTISSNEQLKDSTQDQAPESFQRVWSKDSSRILQKVLRGQVSGLSKATSSERLIEHAMTEQAALTDLFSLLWHASAD